MKSSISCAQTYSWTIGHQRQSPVVTVADPSPLRGAFHFSVDLSGSAQSLCLLPFCNCFLFQMSLLSDSSIARFNKVGGGKVEGIRQTNRSKQASAHKHTGVRKHARACARAHTHTHTHTLTTHARTHAHTHAHTYTHHTHAHTHTYAQARSRRD